MIFKTPSIVTFMIVIKEQTKTIYIYAKYRTVKRFHQQREYFKYSISKEVNIQQKGHGTQFSFGEHHSVNNCMNSLTFKI